MNLSTLYREMAQASEQLKRGRVWCTVCGVSAIVDAAWCLEHGWPKCCGYTMTIDSPKERGKHDGDSDK